MKENIIRKEILKKYKNCNWIHRNFIAIRSNRDCFKIIEKEVPKIGIIIDLGCGHGYFSHFLALTSPNRKIIGIDDDISKIKVAKKFNDTKNLKFLAGDIRKVNIPPANAIVLLDVLFYLNDRDKEGLIKEIFKKLKKGGLLIIKESAFCNKFGILELNAREALVTTFWRRKPCFIFFYRGIVFWKKFFKKFNFSKIAFKRPQGKGYVLILAKK